MTPKEFLISYVKKFNSGDISSLISLYETEACFVSREGEVVKGIDNVRQRLQSFINMNGRIESKVIGVIHTNDIALVNTEWSFNGSGPDGKAVTITGKATDVLRQQSDGTWRILIDNPWGTNLQMTV
ncbi:MAG TPA: nuclear transport factor 2 family protein [Nitrososphaeraceae archaeon]|nr:nuclear transport factor 2 family protein [Nitrososphaeraceae archaeon]